MLQPRSMVVIADNSGPKSARIFYVRGDFNKNVKTISGSIRDRVRMSIHEMRKFKARRLSKRKRTTLFHSMKRWGYVVRTRVHTRYRCDSLLLFSSNACVIYWRKDRIRGRRTYGITTRFLAFRWLLNKFRFYF